MHQGQLHYPGNESGHPVRLPPGSALPLLRDKEWQRLQTEWDVKCEAFFTWEPQSLARYTQVLDRIANQQFYLIQRTKPEYDEEHQGWRIWVEWKQPYARIPTPNGLPV